MPVKDEQATHTDGASLRVSVEVLQLLYSKLVVCIAIVADCDRTVTWDIFLIPGR
jgi:hypothetical protein